VELLALLRLMATALLHELYEHPEVTNKEQQLTHVVLLENEVHSESQRLQGSQQAEEQAN